MSTSKKQKKPAAGTPGNPLPVIPEAVLEQFAPEGPMTAEAVQSASMAFKKALIERAMRGELSRHLGYAPGATPAPGGNHRNGASGKTVLTENGPLRIDVPRDWSGSFEPILIPKHERRFTGFDDKIVAMYARGMSVREIQAFLAEQYGTEVSAEFISSVTDEVMAEVTAWQSRPLEQMYPVVFFDALRVKIRDEEVVRTGRPPPCGTEPGVWKSVPVSGIVGVEMTRILKRKDFGRWQAGEKLPDAALCKAVKEMESGLIDADLGGFLYKKRVARPGGGKSGGYRTLLSARIDNRYVFLHGFPKSDKANITQDEKKALQFAGKVFLELSAEALSKALQSGVLLEVHCEQDH